MQKCNGCGSEMPISVLKPMVRLDGKRAYVEMLCPACQQKYGDHNPNYYYIQISADIIASLVLL